MEYEIKDEPQGLGDRPEGDRLGGLREDPVELRKRKEREARITAAAYEERMVITQMG